jgi:hypothetical protein
MAKNCSGKHELQPQGVRPDFMGLDQYGAVFAKAPIEQFPPQGLDGGIPRACAVRKRIEVIAAKLSIEL